MKKNTNQLNVYSAIHTILEHIGEDPTRDGLKETADRMVRSWDELLCGYRSNPAELFKLFDSEGYNEMIILKNIEFYSMCEHHFLGFHGVAHVAYIPKDKIIGISKLARLVEVFSHRLQVQERLTMQIANTLVKYLKPVGAGVILEGGHSCMGCRGVKNKNTKMITSMLKGSFLQPKVRQEFLALSMK